MTAAWVAPEPKVLVAEDDPSVRLTIEFVLQDEGFEVLLAEDGEQALKIALNELPDLILLDQIMPKLDGKQVLSALREDDRTSHIPVFVLTGMPRGAPEEWPGAQFVGKPFEPDELVRLLRQRLGRKT